MLNSLRAILIAYLAALTCSGLLLSGWMVQQQQQLAELLKQEEYTLKLDTLTDDLVYLASEQNFQVNTRTSQQWDARMRTLQFSLSEAPESLRHAERFLALQTSFNRADEHKKQLMSAENPRLRERYLLLLMTHTRQATTDLRNLRQMASEQSNEISVSRTHYALVSFVCLLLFSLFLAIFVWLRIKQPINALVEGLNQFAQGNLHHPIQDVEIQELHRIVAASNAMAKNLASLTVSRDELLAEIERRKTVEQKLHDREEQMRVDHLRRLEDRERMIQVEKLSALGTMVGGVAHEINNPLMGVMNFVEYARDKATDEKSIKVLGQALDQIERIKQIVRNMLVFVAGDTVQTDTSDVREAVAQTLSLLEGEFKKYAIQVTVDWPEQVSMVRCNSGSLQQVLLNLLLNARDAMVKQDERRIHLHWEQTAARGLLYVSDSGPGVPTEIQSRIFDPFFTTKPAGQGTGLGLSVSQRLMEAAGGGISLCHNVHGDFCMLLEFDLVLGEDKDK